MARRPLRWTPAHFLVAVVVIAAILLVDLVVAALPGFLALSVLHLVVGLYVFALHGGRLMTATGLYYLGTAVFVGAAGFYVALSETVDMEAAFAASIAIFFGNILLYAMRFRRGGRVPDLGRSDVPVAVPASRSSLSIGVALLAVALVAKRMGLEALGPIPHALAFSGVVILFVSVALSVAGERRAVLVASVIACVGLAAFVDVFFDGFGRLNIVGLLLAGGLALNSLRPRIWHKRLLVVLLIPAWIIAGIVGLDRRPTPTEVSVQDVLLGGEGLESGFSGLELFAQIVSLETERSQLAFPRQYGLTLVKALTAPIPRTWWEKKPVGFGFSLTLHFLPQYAASGHSMVATSFGEWYVNFWWFGFVVMPAVLASALRFMDDWQTRLRVSGLASRADLLSLVVFVSVASSIPNYVWASLFSVIARAGIRVLLLVPIWLGVRWIEGARPSPVMAGRT